MACVRQLLILTDVFVPAKRGETLNVGLVVMDCSSSTFQAPDSVIDNGTTSSAPQRARISGKP